MNNAIAWITENYLVVVGIVGGLRAVANLIAKLTKTTKDDEVLAKLEAAFDKVEDVVTPDSE